MLKNNLKRFINNKYGKRFERDHSIQRNNRISKECQRELYLRMHQKERDA